MRRPAWGSISKTLKWTPSFWARGKRRRLNWPRQSDRDRTGDRFPGSLSGTTRAKPFSPAQGLFLQTSTTSHGPPVTSSPLKVSRWPRDHEANTKAPPR
ncbi:MAG: hypothetical protein MZV64_36915 [Ignavibacteriales bacterium]|nr:hypothetical protein [Ignavibacteriales bacterium]